MPKLSVWIETALIAVMIWATVQHGRCFTLRPVKHEHRHDRRAFPPSKLSLREQNMAIDGMGLPRFKNDADVQAAYQRGELTSVFGGITIDPTLPAANRYLRWEAMGVLESMSAEFYSQFGHNFVVTSMLRTGRYQFHLRFRNHNAASVRGPLASSHLAGTTFDIGRKRMTREQTQWVEDYLFNLGSLVIVEEENGQACFHIFVRG
jgi:hypothetical protein